MVNDGSKKPGYLAPSAEGQAQTAEDALKDAGVSADSIDFIEAHGTGTRLGDPIEIRALSKAYARPGDAEKCAIGSVKSNLGHLDTAAGIASFIKAALSLNKASIPPLANFSKPSQMIDWQKTPFYLPSSEKTWSKNKLRRAAINSTGVGGTNAHVIIEQAPNLERKSISGKSEHLVLLLSAKSERSLKLMAQKLALWLEQQEDEDLPDILANLGLYRPKFGYGLSIVAETKDGLISKLKHSASSDHPSVRNKNETSKRVVFMYPGGGSQYGNMARDLYEHDSTFREELESALSVAYAATGVDFRSVLLPKRDEIERVSQLMRNKPAYAMVATVMIEYCLTKLLLSKGLEPWSMIGHSLGEYTAAVVAEVMTLGDAFKLLWARGRLSAKVPAGSMLAVSLSPDKLQPLLFGSLDISVENAPELSVVSGSKEDLKKLREVLQGFENINTREIPIEIPAHSQLLAPVLDEFSVFVKASTSNNRHADLSQAILTNGPTIRLPLLNTGEITL